MEAQKLKIAQVKLLHLKVAIKIIKPKIQTGFQAV
jgi:hypothetical protein